MRVADWLMHTSIHFPIAKTNRFNARCTLAARSTKTTFHQISCAWELRQRERSGPLSGGVCVYFYFWYFAALARVHARTKISLDETKHLCALGEQRRNTPLLINRNPLGWCAASNIFTAKKHLTPDERSSQCSWTASQENKNSGRTVKMHLGCDFLIYSLVGDFISLTFPGNW